jgi:hypothetical protein
VTITPLQHELVGWWLGLAGGEVVGVDMAGAAHVGRGCMLPVLLQGCQRLSTGDHCQGGSDWLQSQGAVKGASQNQQGPDKFGGSSRP